MKEIVIQNINSVCRTCLKDLEEQPLLGEKYSLHDRKDLEKLLMSCISVEFVKNIELPGFVCHACYDHLLSFYDFCSKSTESLCFLIHILTESKQDQFDKEEFSDNDQGSENEENADVGDICEINQPRSREKPQNCSENTVVKFSQEPTEFLVTAKKAMAEPFDEIETEVEVDISDIELNAKSILSITSYTEQNSFEYLEICQESRDEDKSISVQSSILLDEEYATDSEQLSETSAKLSKNERSNRNKNSEKGNVINKLKKNTSVEQSQISIGEGITKFQCEQCPRRCVTWENYEAHLRTHQGLRPFLCKECGHSFNRATHYRVHMREVHGPVSLTFICSFEGCGKIFNREGSYKFHYRVKHNPAYSNCKTSSFVCEDCGKTFGTKTKLKEHRYKHLPIEEYPYKCNYCGKRYKARRNYKDHQLRHAGIKNFICSYCGVKKTTKTELRTHINYHTKEKQWPCSKCPSIFNNSSNLGKHDRIVHKGLRPYTCSYCGKTFGKQDTWKNHEMRHTGEKPHCCDLCGKRFIQSVALRAHMKTHNKENSKMSLDLQEKETSGAIVEGTLD